MDDSRFDVLVRSVVGMHSRRAVLGLLASLSLGELDKVAAKKKHRKKNKNKGQSPSPSSPPAPPPSPPPPPCATSCGGCCDGSGSCQLGTTVAACGAGGGGCTTCAAGQGCQNGTCVTLPCGQGGPCLVFVSSTTQYGNLSELDGADGTCQQLAMNAVPAPLPGTYKAWLANNSDNPANRFVRSTGPYRLVNGTTIAANWDDLTDGTLAAPINVTQNGAAVSEPVKVWTSVSPSGNTAGAAVNCDSWRSGGSNNYGIIGVATSSSGSWTRIDPEEPCNNQYRLYCFQQS